MPPAGSEARLHWHCPGSISQGRQQERAQAPAGRPLTLAGLLPALPGMGQGQGLTDARRRLAGRAAASQGALQQGELALGEVLRALIGGAVPATAVWLAKVH